MQAAQNPNEHQGLSDFGSVVWRHGAYLIKNGLRAVGHGWTLGRWAKPNADAPTALRGAARRLHWYAAAFAFVADVAMLSLGGGLKRKEKLSARLGDILSLLFIATAVIRKFDVEGQRADHAALAQWAAEDCLYQAAQAFRGVLANFPHRAVAATLRLALFPLGLRQRPPSDQLGGTAARTITHPGEARDALTESCFVPSDVSEPLGALEAALVAAQACDRIDAKIRAAEKRGQFAGDPRANVRDLPQLALAQGVITVEEANTLAARDALTERVIQVDDFAFNMKPVAHDAQDANANTDHHNLRQAA